MMKPKPDHLTMRHLLTTRLVSFRHAFAGLTYVLRSQPNAWIHAAATIAVVLVGMLLDLARNEWALIAVTIAAVWTTEILNTAIETAVDLAFLEPHPLAKIAKDCAAAAVLITAGMAVVVGILLLGPGLWDKFGF